LIEPMNTRFTAIAAVLMLLVGSEAELRSQTVESSKLLNAIYNEKADTTTFFISNMMIVAETFGPEVYSVTEGRNKRLPSSIVKMVVYISFPGKKRAVPNKVVLAFDSGHYRTYQFGVNRDLVIKADGETMDLGAMKLTDRRDVNDKNNLFGNVHMWETLELSVDVAEYRKIIDAKKVSMWIGDLTADLNDEQLKRLRKFADEYLK